MTQTQTLNALSALRAWRVAYPAKFDGICALCGGVTKTGEPVMKYSIQARTVYGHDVCPEVPQMPEAKPDRDAPSADFGPIVAHFNGIALRKGKRAKIHFIVGDDELIMKWSAQTNKINIAHATETVWNERSGEYWPRWYGRINSDGTLTRSGQMTVAIETEISAWGDDVIGNAVRFAKISGNCCFCGKHITTDESLTVGYGPTCANTHGLPWG